MLRMMLYSFIVTFLPVLTGTLWVTRNRALKLIHPIRSRPDRNPSDPDLNITNWEEVEFCSLDGVPLAGWFIPPSRESDGATMVFVHGLGSNRSELLDQAAMLVSYGYGALLLDLRNHGDSAGDMTTLGYYEVEDVRGAVNYLKTRAEVNDELIGLIGVSMGGATVLRAAARLPEVKLVIAQAAYTSIKENIKQGVRVLTGLPPFPFSSLIIFFGQRRAQANIVEVTPIEDLVQIGMRPIMFIHGALDRLITVSNAEQLYNAALGPKELYVVDDAGHNRLEGYDPAEFERRVVAFIETHLRRD